MPLVKEVDFPLPHPALPNADWVDCYRVETNRNFSNARQAADAIVTSFPKWTYPALVLRQVLVSPFGLKGEADVPSVDKIGIFPVVSETENEVTAGMDDKHLDFRIVVQLSELGDRQSVSLATIIKRHNRLGRFYLQSVLPFHKAIIKGALSRIA